MKNKKLLAGVFAATVIPLAIYLIFAIVRPQVFLRADVIYLLFIQSIETIIMAWGMSFGMISGNFDMSIAAEVTLGTIVAALAAKTLGVAGIVLGALLSCLIVGFLKSLVLRITKTSSLVISIAYVLILGALGAVLTASKSLIITSQQSILGKAPWNILIFVLMGALMYYLHKYSKFGAHCRAIGGNANLAKNAGIDKFKTYSWGFIIASLYAGVSAVISLSRGAGAAPATGLQALTPIFNAMIGVFLAMMLGRWVNIVLGIISGILAMNILGYGLLSIGMQTDLKNTITGGFLIIVMTVMSVREFKAREKMRRELFDMQRAAKHAKKSM